MTSDRAMPPLTTEVTFAVEAFVQPGRLAPETPPNTQAGQRVTKTPTPETPLPTTPQSLVWGTQFASLTMQQVVDLADRIVRRGVPEYFVTANLNYLMLTEQHPRLAEINRASAAVIADGHPIVLRSRCSESPLPGRVAGSDLIIELSRLAAANGYRMFFLGAAPGVAQAAADRLKERFPDLQIAGCCSPPFRQLSTTEHDQLLQEIRQSRPDILLVAFGQPKGETWIADHRRQLGVPLSIQLGASFDFLAGTARRAPRGWQRCGCEWLYRALSDPRRLAPRYAMNVLYLLKLLIRDVCRIQPPHVQPRLQTPDDQPHAPTPVNQPEARS